MRRLFRSIGRPVASHIPAVRDRLFVSEVERVFTAIAGMLRLGSQLGARGPGDVHASAIDRARAVLVRSVSERVDPVALARTAQDLDEAADFVQTLALKSPYSHSEKILRTAASQVRADLAARPTGVRNSGNL